MKVRLIPTAIAARGRGYQPAFRSARPPVSARIPLLRGTYCAGLSEAVQLARETIHLLRPDVEGVE